MAGYIVRRLFTAFLVVVVTSIFVFTLFFKGPANPAQPLCDLNGKCTPEKLAILTEQMGLNDSVVHQYLIFIGGFVRDREVTLGATYECPAPCLGISFGTRQPVTADLVDKYPATLSLAIGGALLYLVIGVLLGSLAARVRGTAADRTLVGASLVLGSIPYYVFALLAWIFFSLQWRIFPDTTYVGITDNPARWFWHLMLPWLCLGLWSSASYARYTRGSMVETLGEDYIRTAKAKGVSQRTVMVKHAMRAAIVPVLTIFGLDFGALLAGTVFTETIFDIDGVGNWSIRALRAPLDFPVILATTLVLAVAVVLSNLVVDLLYGVLDPRVRLA